MALLAGSGRTVAALADARTTGAPPMRLAEALAMTTLGSGGALAFTGGTWIVGGAAAAAARCSLAIGVEVCEVAALLEAIGASDGTTRATIAPTPSSSVAPMAQGQ